MYIPTNGPGMSLRTFIAAMLEILRRWQWNFCKLDVLYSSIVRAERYADRLENEHLGNVDQYRITREIPLYYARDNLAELIDAEDDKNDK